MIIYIQKGIKLIIKKERNKAIIEGGRASYIHTKEDAQYMDCMKKRGKMKWN